MSRELLIGLAGGAIGAVLAGLFAQTGRAWTAWGEVSLHDEESAERTRQLAVWVDDRTQELAVDLKQRSGRARQMGQARGGAHGVSRAWAKARALHEYRDQEWRARIDLSRIRAKENGWHAWWRFCRRRSAPHVTVQTLSDVEPFLDRWRAPVTSHGGPAVEVLDRTRRTISDAKVELPSLDLN